jgi:hypothetical protein
MLDLESQAKAINEIANSKGWERPHWDANFVQKIAFVITEINEGVEGVHGTDKDPIEVELADTAIRILDILEGIWPGKWSQGRVTGRRRNTSRLFAPIEVAVWPIVKSLCKAIESWRVNAPDSGKQDAMILCELALLETFRVADRLGIDLPCEIEKKCSLNALRPPQHGKGRSVG